MRAFAPPNDNANDSQYRWEHCHAQVGKWRRLESLCLSVVSRGGPTVRVFEKASHLSDAAVIEVALRLGGGECVPPGAKRMQLDAGSLQLSDALGEDAVVEHDEAMCNLCAGVTQCFDEAKFAAPVRRQVLDQKHAGTFRKASLDPGIAPETLGLFAHVDHG